MEISATNGKCDRYKEYEISDIPVDILVKILKNMLLFGLVQVAAIRQIAENPIPSIKSFGKAIANCQ